MLDAGHTDIVVYLIEQGVDSNLDFMARDGKLDTIKLLESKNLIKPTDWGLIIKGATSKYADDSTESLRKEIIKFANEKRTF